MNWLIVFAFMSLFQKDCVPEDLLWKHRILIYSGEGGFAASLSEDLAKDLTTRKLLYFQFRESKLINSNFKEPIQSEAFLRKLELDPTVKEKWVLIGLDGGIKNSGLGSPSPAAIFRIIDAMPMRQSEIRSGDK